MTDVAASSGATAFDAASGSRASRVVAALLRPVDVAWLAAFRVFFGLTMCVSMLRFLAYGWVDQLFVKPSFHFKYWGWEWVQPLSAPGMHALFWVLAGLALAVAAGACFRVAAVLFVAGFTYLQLIDVTTYLNHYYLASLLGVLLAISPAHRAWSIDAWPFRRTATTTIPTAWLYVMRFQVGVVYTFAGLAKANGDWLLHAQPLGIWLGSSTDLPVIGQLFSEPWCAPMMSWAGFLFDTSIPWLLLVPRARPWAYLAVIVFHVLTRALFPIGMFPVIMVLSALVFFSPSWPRALATTFRRSTRGFGRQALARVETGPPIEPAGVSRIGSAAGWRGAVALGLGAAYCALQVALPLRAFAYGGDVRWHEQGMRFSWRVMVREKNGSVTFVVRSPSRGRTWHIQPERYLTRLQAREMSARPDLILQLARHIGRDFERRGYGPVSVRVDARASLNGRRLRRLIDPDVDLSGVEDGLGRAAWILPGPAEPPPRIRPI